MCITVNISQESLKKPIMLQTQIQEQRDDVIDKGKTGCEEEIWQHYVLH